MLIEAIFNGHNIKFQETSILQIGVEQYNGGVAMEH